MTRLTLVYNKTDPEHLLPNRGFKRGAGATHVAQALFDASPNCVYISSVDSESQIEKMRGLVSPENIIVDAISETIAFLLATKIKEYFYIDIVQAICVDSSDSKYYNPDRIGNFAVGEKLSVPA